MLFKFHEWVEFGGLGLFVPFVGLESEGNCERVFSWGKLVLSDLRSHMDPKNAGALVLVGSNWDELPDEFKPTMERITEAHEAKYGSLQPATTVGDDQPMEEGEGKDDPGEEGGEAVVDSSDE